MLTAAFSRRFGLLSWSAIALLTLTGFLSPAIATQSPTANPIDRPSLADPTLVAQRALVKRVQFAPGKSSVTLRDSVVLGTRNVYLLNAQRGQRMVVRVASLENNAEFDLAIAPSRNQRRQLLKEGVKTWSGVLPTTGDYQIVVGSARGNATYTLQVIIR